MIRNLHVQNFKSFKDISLNLGQRNVLVGPNMSGKSNLLDVFRFLSRMVVPPVGVYGLPNAVQSLHGFQELVWKGGDSSVVQIAIDGDTSPPFAYEIPATWSYKISIRGDPRGWINVLDESLVVSGPTGESSLIESTGGRRQLKNSDGRTVSEAGGPERSALEYEIPDWEGDALRQFFASFRFYNLVSPLLRTVNQTVAASFLSERGENLASWLLTLQTKHSRVFDRIARIARDVLPDLESLFTAPTQQGTVFVASRERFLKRPISDFQMSDGELVFIALLSLIYSPSELRSPLICVEEPENHLHLRLLEAVVELLKQVQEELPPGERAQVLVTTHSPHLIDLVSLDELIVFEKREGATTATRPGNKEHLRRLLEEEETGLGSLYYSGALGGDS
jgi:predicted ATPase